MLIVCSERVDEKNFQEILCNVKTPIILQILSSQSMLRWMSSLIHIWCHFVVMTSERNMVIKPMQIRTHDSVYIINIAEINNNDRRRFKSRYCSYFLI